MKLSADAIDPAAVRQLHARDLQTQLLADHAGQSASDAVRLPACRFHHVSDRRAIRVAKEPEERVLATSLGWSRRNSRGVRSGGWGARLFRAGHRFAVQGQLANICGLQGEGTPFLVIPPDCHRVGCGHFPYQPAFEQAFADVPDRSSLQPGHDREDAEVLTAAGGLKDGVLGFGELHDHGWRSSSVASAGSLRFYEVEPQGWGRGADADSLACLDKCSDADLKQAASAASG